LDVGLGLFSARIPGGAGAILAATPQPAREILGNFVIAPGGGPPPGRPKNHRLRPHGR
jgi:hypothetical protein